MAEADTLGQLGNLLHRLEPRPNRGRLVAAIGCTLRAILPQAQLGELCSIERRGSQPPLLAEVVGFDAEAVILAPLGDTAGLSPGLAVHARGEVLQVPVGAGLLGRVVDGLGRPLDEVQCGPLPAGPRRPTRADPPPALSRQLVQQPMPLGVRAIDALLTCAEGQRLGIYGEPGGGKSTLLASMIRGAEVDIIVVALVGERGREVRDFIEHQIDAATRARTVLVVATSDRPSIERVKASYTATTIAESFRDLGHRVLLVIDSVTRFARALREIGLAAGEAPSRRGFPASVFAELPRLLERAGPGAVGSMTAIYTVLVEGDGSGDPIAEETRSILDGHLVLSPALAAAGHYPAIDILTSRSRVMNAVVNDAHRLAAQKVRALLQRYQEIEFLVQVGEYQAGGDPESDLALARIAAIRSFLRQPSHSASRWDETLAGLMELGA